ncbi:hypothetical protein [uncultured Jatrophihabitans sp.]|uniref:hypothetical protein n=1 Tax=uncultured Jatrophihabitans sp. TaxID=1610747 RepID=UPI0035C9FB22
MSTVALFTAKGAPGATTDAMLFAALWPRRNLLIDCDPAGGDIALRLPGDDGSSLDVSTGMLTLLPLARRPMQPTDVLTHAQVALGGTELLAGIASPDQAIAAGNVWSTLADLFNALPEHDTIIDVGRLHPTSAVLPLAQRADLAVCVVHASLTGTIAARSRLRTVLPALARDGVGPRCGFVVRAEDRRTAEAAVRVLHEGFEDLWYFGWLPDDPAGASLFEGGRVPRPERTMLVRSGATVVAQLDAALPPDSKRGAQSPELNVAADGNALPQSAPPPAPDAAPSQGHRRAPDHPAPGRGPDEPAQQQPSHAAADGYGPVTAAEPAAQRVDQPPAGWVAAHHGPPPEGLPVTGLAAPEQPTGGRAAEKAAERARNKRGSLLRRKSSV